MGEKKEEGSLGVAWNMKRKAMSNVVIPNMVSIAEVALSCINNTYKTKKRTKPKRSGIYLT